jgi:hypothetical protein
VFFDWGKSPGRKGSSIMRRPIIRPDAFHLYWHFAAERQSIFEKRVAGEPHPWTNDPILQTYKFCNVYRAADRVSQFLIREVAYNPQPAAAADRIFQIIAFRMFSKVQTWRSLCDVLAGQPTIEQLRDGRFERALEKVRQQEGGLYTGAFILCATDAYGRGLKHRNHVELFRHMFVRTDLAARILEAQSLKAIYELLHEYPLMGDFMSYQIAIDLNYSDLVNFDEDDFVKAGPGALRGIKKAFEDTAGFSPEDVIQWMVDEQENEFRRREFDFKGLWGRRLHAIDCQGLFCELDKYCREALPDLKSARQRIKARYASTALEPLVLMFPPKWGLNEHLPRHAVLGKVGPHELHPVQGSLL